MTQQSRSQAVSIWQARWQALDQTLADMDARYTEVANDVPRMNTLRTLGQSLRQFAADQFNFFYDGFGFGNPKPKYRLKTLPQDNYPPEHVFAVTLEQIGFDIEVIQRAANQRIAAEEQAKNGPCAAKDALAQADVLAYAALKPAQDNGLLPYERPTVVTYFQKDTSIRVVPYAPVALIGVPFSCTTVPTDFLAIPHEVGHYVFW